MSHKLANVPPVPSRIQMIDNDDDMDDYTPVEGVPRPQLGRLVIRDVRVGAFNQVSSLSGVPYVVWTVHIHLSTGTTLTIHKRYSEFVKLRTRILELFPQLATYSINSGAKTGKAKLKFRSIPKLTSLGSNDLFWKFGKSERSKASFLDGERRHQLEVFVSFVFLDPTLGSSEVIKRFILE
ncbi:hypothetical protein BABINDRAFT_6128 [Babjeviella inositovora NRRL Y-12698]|uniref:PX domain-containing protein n=1 Tax=Babjeviella inositovora NRRL Y-12698 TaxID=984486 RepID=A0A1E3QV18_9ASCO|nr:uncharacterized protein BABINDRAFT_6128 [Babjeviella inositovora NRRL Y-12698]ODQ81424.1 hypothetical protein BABINDRAFT_6128 [Babjeviella inositovora NRRL Y-12698]